MSFRKAVQAWGELWRQLTQKRPLKVTVEAQSANAAVVELAVTVTPASPGWKARLRAIPAMTENPAPGSLPHELFSRSVLKRIRVRYTDGTSKRVWIRQVKSALIVRPGTVVKHSDRSYRVAPDGSWRRLAVA